jgi:hypothetical protein
VPGVKDTPRSTSPERADWNVRKLSAGRVCAPSLSVMATTLFGSAPWSPLPLTVEVTAQMVAVPFGLTRPVMFRSPSVAAQGSPVGPGQAESAGTWPALALRITCLRNSSAAGSRRRSADQVRVRSRTAPASRISQ